MQEIYLEAGEYVLFDHRTKITRKSADHFELEWEQVRWGHVAILPNTMVRRWTSLL